MYLQVCDELCAWFHVMDHTNYARWLPVHVRDMTLLRDKHPRVYMEFLNGNFVVQKSRRKFSLMAKDQSHEQSNKSLQAHGGATGLYENPEALALYMLAGPDIARCISEFETTLDEPAQHIAHHEEARSLQIRYKKDVLSLVDQYELAENPFMGGQDLLALDTQVVMEPEVVSSLAQVHELGKRKHSEYVSVTLDKSSVPISNTIHAIIY